MYAVVAVPFYDTQENGRADVTIQSLTKLLETVRPPNVVVPVDNGSIERSSAEFAALNFETFIQIPPPLSIAQGVNSGWYPFKDDLDAGRAFAVKHDADLITMPDDWVEKIKTVMLEDPDIYLIGVRRKGAPPRPTIIDHNDYFETDFVFGGVQARSPGAWKDIGYAKQPAGRWGWGDHWDAFRVRHLKKKIVCLKNVVFQDMVQRSALPDEEKTLLRTEGQRAYLRMREEVKKGIMPVYQEFDGWQS